MRFLKKLATICLALIMCLGLGSVFTACDDDSSASTEQPADVFYTFYVIKDEKPAVGYSIQLCEALADGSTGTFCYFPATVGADGIAKVEITKPELNYVIHIMKNETTLENAHTTDNAELIANNGNIPANYNGGTITLIITK